MKILTGPLISDSSNIQRCSLGMRDAADEHEDEDDDCCCCWQWIRVRVLGAGLERARAKGLEDPIRKGEERDELLL